MKQMELNKKAPYQAPESTLVLIRMEQSLLITSSSKRNQDYNEVFWLDDEEEFF